MTRQSPRSVLRIASSLARLRAGRPLTRAPLARGGPLVHVDLRRPLGLGHYRYGNTEPEVAVVASLLSGGATFVDGGANVGVFTLFAARAVGPAGRVIAIEAAPATFALLRRNVELNDMRNVELVQAALGAAPGWAELVAFEAASGMSSFAPADASGGEIVRVAVRTLDEIAGALTSECVLKLDVEGAEVHALRGAGELLAEMRPDILVELEAPHLARQGTTVEELCELLARAGYGWCPDMRQPDRVVSLPSRSWADEIATVNVLVRPLGPRRSR